MITVNARAIPRAGAPFEATTIERRDVGAHDVLITIAYAGICHTDIHIGRNEWGEAAFPLIPGHEIAGLVSAVGSDVTRFAVGDRAGVGCLVASCRVCEHCRAGHEQYCGNGPTWTYNAVDTEGRPTAGGYSEQIVVDENYVVGIPAGVSLDAAAPLLCAGITMYSPLRRWGAGPGRSVAIAGLGGLGHVGVKIAKAMGGEVTVLSQSPQKQADSLRLGADHYHATGDPSTFEELARSFDLIISTLPAEVDITAYLALLKLDGIMVQVGISDQLLSVPVSTLITRRVGVTGSLIGGIGETQEMLDFCAQRGIGADVEIIRGDQIDEAWDRVVASDVRYRFVIDATTIAG